MKQLSQQSPAQVQPGSTDAIVLQLAFLRNLNPFTIVLSELWTLNQTNSSEKLKSFDCQHPTRG